MNAILSLSLSLLMPVALSQAAFGQKAAQAEPPRHERIPAEQVTKAGALFNKTCASCHFVPDVGEATDRAWLGQVRETS